MTNLFAFGSAYSNLDADDRYGTTGDMKKTQYVMQLLGFPGDADTLKCLLAAGEKGIEVESGVVDISSGQQDSKDYRKISPLGIIPALK
jgi:glutathione S-transferase